MPSLSVALPLFLSLTSALPNGLEGVHPLERRGTAASQRVSIPALEAQGMTAYLEKAIPFAESSGSEIAAHTLPITPVEGVSPTQRYINIMMEDAQAPNNGSAPQAEGEAGTSPIKNVNNIVFMTTTNVGGQDFQLVLDTGSADTWLVSTPFKCLNNLQQETNVKVCKFAKEYKRSSSFVETAGHKLKTAYADGEKLTGIIGRETVSIAGVTVKNQTIGLVQQANWHGDGFSSGLLGMAFPAVTRAMAGEGAGTAQRYDPVFFSMHKQGLIKPVFALTLNRANEGPGALSLGGLPGGNIKYAQEFAAAPLEKLALKGSPGKADFTLYIVKAQGFTVNDKPAGGPANLIVDSGTTLSYLPNEVVSAVKSQWPGLSNGLGGQMMAPCNGNGSPPKIGFTIGGKQVFIDPKDLIMTGNGFGGTCMVGIAASKGLGGAGMNLLGGPFLKSVLAVFDVGAGQMRFHQRVR